MDQLPGWQCAGASEDRAPELCFLGDGICQAWLKAFMALDYDVPDWPSDHALSSHALIAAQQ
jgi:hypothetical protein